MKNNLLILILILFGINIGYAQIFDPVDWSYETEQVNENEYKLKFTAAIEKGWYVYSQDIPEDGPIPTSFTFEDNEHVELQGSTVETGSKVKRGFDKVFEMDIKKFAEKAIFTQLVKVNSSTTIKGSLEFMTCDDERCLPPDIKDFSFTIALGKEDRGAIDKEPGIEEKITTTTSSSSNSKESEKDISGEEAEKINKVESTETKSTKRDQTVDVGKKQNNFKKTIPGISSKKPSGILEPLEWAVEVSKVTEKEWIISLKATIENGWYVYSKQVPEGGPIATELSLDESSLIELIGAVEESGKKVEEGFDDVFEMDIKKFAGQATFSQRINVLENQGKISGSIYFMVCDDGHCLPPDYVDFEVDLAQGEGQLIDELTAAEQTDEELFLHVKNYTPTKERKSSLMIFLLGLVGGLFALFTPCVFPMIPLTVSYFTKSSSSRSKGIMNAIFYGMSIFFIYVLLSSPFHLMNISPDILNEISTNIWLNLGFFLIFVVFAFSFFGYYEIALPSGLANKVSSAESTGGFIGIFFMALTLAIVSFSCTGPIIGSLLAGTLTQGAWHLTAGMAGFGIALGLPFALFALFPGWLNNIPKSGGWLNTVKVVLGFIELALALKFLSNADLVAHWGILKREIFFGLWIVICLLTAAYLFGWINFPHDSKYREIGKLNMGFAALFVIFAIYITPGVWGKNISLLSGFPPPNYYRIFKSKQAEHEFHSVTAKDRENYDFSDDCPYGLPCFKDFFEAEKYAIEKNKPILVDFTGYACVNCRRMEENVWSKEGILEILGNEVVLVSLYVDDKELLPEELQRTASFKDYQKQLKTVGNMWSFFETINFDINSQPLYVIMTPDREILMEPVGYTPNPEKYKSLLQDALNKFKDANLSSNN